MYRRKEVFRKSVYNQGIMEKFFLCEVDGVV